MNRLRKHVAALDRALAANPVWPTHLMRKKPGTNYYVRVCGSEGAGAMTRLRRESDCAACLAGGAEVGNSPASAPVQSPRSVAEALRARLERDIAGLVRERVTNRNVAEELMYFRYALRMLDEGDYDGAIGAYASGQRSGERRRAR